MAASCHTRRCRTMVLTTKKIANKNKNVNALICLLKALIDDRQKDIVRRQLAVEKELAIIYEIECLKSDIEEVIEEFTKED